MIKLSNTEAKRIVSLLIRLKSTGKTVKELDNNRRIKLALDKLTK